MLKVTKTGVFCAFIIIIFFIIQIFINQYSIESEIGKEIMDVPKVEAQIPIIKESDENWQIEIPKIFLIANISETTTKEILNKYVGHFQNTTKEYGNICLAGFNRGYDNNYFKNLKLLKKGDEIIYKHNKFEKRYQVEKCRIIKSSDFRYLEGNEENMLTLITYIQNQPEYRRCIQATEIEINN